jgi:hypothetical protein
MVSKRWDLLDEVLAKCARLACNAPDKYPDFLKVLGASMDYDFNQIEENIAELRNILKKDLDTLEAIANKIQQARTCYYGGQYEQGEDVLWEIYNDERVMKLK